MFVEALAGGSRVTSLGEGSVFIAETRKPPITKSYGDGSSNTCPEFRITSFNGRFKMERAMTKILYRDMDRAALDAAFDNTKAISNFPAVFARFQHDSQETYSTYGGRRDLRYGEKARERYDFIPSGRAAQATYIFLHGGYWSHCAKEDFAFIAGSLVPNGINVALAEYTLAPEISVTGIVEEIGGLIQHLSDDRDRLGIETLPLYLGGHSAGGHLALMYRAHPAISRVHAISPLVDLEPMRLCWLQDSLKLTYEETRTLSPIRHIKPGAPTMISVGADELIGLRSQATEYALACEAAGERIGLLHVPGCTHFSILEDLANPVSWQLEAFLKLV